jgi:tripartite-type tricarboxylate transporter receptor subunit TctC
MKKEHWLKIVIVIGLLIVGLISESTNCKAADKYPSRPIQIVIGYEPGSTDAALKVFTDKMAEILGQPMTYVYKPGATGSIGVSYVVNSKPDGYTLSGAAPGPIITGPLTIKGVNYSLDDVLPICRMSAQPTALFVKSDARWKTLKDFIDEAKKNPGKLSVSSSGVFGTSGVPVEQLQRVAGFKITHIPVQGGAAVLPAVLGGHVDMGSAPTSAVGSQLKAGMIRALAMIFPQRSQDFPDTATLVDLGYPVTYSGWNALFGPKGMSVNVLQTLDRACGRALQDNRKEIEDKYNKMGIDVAYLNAEDFAKDLQNERERTKKIIDEIQKTEK